MNSNASTYFTSVWNLLSHKYKDVLIGLKGSKSMFTFFSFPSSVTMVPQYITRPFGGTEKRNKDVYKVEGPVVQN